MRLADFRDDRLRGGTRVRGLCDRATHDQVVGAIADGRGERGDALLIADRPARGTYAGGDKDELGADGLARHGRFLSARHQSVDAELKRLSGSPPGRLAP